MLAEQVDFILLIFNCKKYYFKALKQKETWLKDFNCMPYFHVIGDPQLTKDYSIDKNEHILYVKVEDDYNSLPKKVIAAYAAINSIYVFKYIFKTDDDQNLTSIRFLETMKQILLIKIPKIHYAGYIVNVDKPHLSQYYKIHPELPEHLPILQTQYCSGRFYILSNLAIDHLISKRSYIEQEYFEDYAIGLNLHPILKKNILNIQTQKYFNDFS
jgi:hypothetical protein